MVRKVRALVEWVGNGRKLTQAGRITLADARVLVTLLGTGDRIDPVIGDRVYRTQSSEDLGVLNLVVTWAKAARLLRVASGKLLPVKKNLALLDQPARLWSALFGCFDSLGAALYPSQWLESPLKFEFPTGVETALLALYTETGPLPLTDLGEAVWRATTATHDLRGATDQQLATWQGLTDRDLRLALGVLAWLDVVRSGDGSAELTERGRRELARRHGAPEPGEPVYQVRLTLAEVEPPVWRRVLVPAAIRLDRLHQVIQAAMGWTDSHLHAFTTGDGTTYGLAGPDSDHRDERDVTLGQLARPGDRVDYWYDFGDDWHHDLVIENETPAAAGMVYPRCVAGAGACPPEDCGGVWGYADLCKILTNPDHEEHDDMLSWLGLSDATEFDPARFDPAAVTRSLVAATTR